MCVGAIASRHGTARVSSSSAAQRALSPGVCEIGTRALGTAHGTGCAARVHTQSCCVLRGTQSCRARGTACTERYGYTERHGRIIITCLCGRGTAYGLLPRYAWRGVAAGQQGHSHRYWEPTAAHVAYRQRRPCFVGVGLLLASYRALWLFIHLYSISTFIFIFIFIEA